MDKLELKQGDKVAYEVLPEIKGTGIICGEAWKGLVDFWVIKADKPIDGYPFECFVVPEGCLKKV